MQLTMKDLKKMNPLESSFEEKMVKKIKKLFPDCYEIPKPIRPSMRGTPDRMFVINGKFIAIETKRVKNSVTAQKQLERLDNVNRAGGYGCVAKEWETVENLLKDAGLL